MNFSEKLKRLRKEHHNITHKQLSEATGISVDSISSYEQGRRKPKLKQLMAFANFFNVPVLYLQNDDIDLDELEQSAVRDVNPDIISRFSQFCLNVDETTLNKIHTLLLTLMKIYDSSYLTADQKLRVIDALTQSCGFTGEYINKNISTKILSKYFLDSLKLIIETENAYSKQEELKNYITSNFNQLNIKGLQRLSDYSDDLIGNPVYITKPAKSDNLIEFIDADEADCLRLKHSLIIPFFDDAVSAGMGEEFINNAKQFIRIPQTYKKLHADYAVRISGNSMEPNYKDGDILLVRFQQQLEFGDLGIFIANNKMYFKKLGIDRLMSLNPDYEDLIFTVDFIPVAQGKVISKIER